jgi:hypothetical protein
MAVLTTTNGLQRVGPLLRRAPGSVSAVRQALINARVSIETVRQRLGRACTKTTQLYTMLAEEVADAKIGAARRCATRRRVDRRTHQYGRR